MFQEAGDQMPNDAEIIKDTVNEFQKIQAHMKNAREENATKTYNGLKKDYKSLKAILASLGVNLTDIDEIKEYVPITFQGGNAWHSLPGLNLCYLSPVST